MKTRDIIQEALDFENQIKSFRSRNDKIIATKKAKEIVLGINEIYKQTKDDSLMEIMKRITLIKQKFDKRLKGRLTI